MSAMFFRLACSFLLSLLLGACGSLTEKAAISDGPRLGLQQALDSHNFFRLASELDQYRDSLTPPQRLFFESVSNNAFNQNEAAIREADSLLNGVYPAFPDSLKAYLVSVRANSYFRIFQYARTASGDSLLLHDYRGWLQGTQADEDSNQMRMCNALAGQPPQVTEIRDSASIPWKKDRLGLIEIPVVCHSKTYSGIFDSRANISSITSTYARKLGLQILPGEFNEGSGITGIRFKTRLGMADSLHIGPIVLRHVVFQVMPDSILYIGAANFSLNLIIGFPVIADLQQIAIRKNGTLFIPIHPEPGTFHNFAISGLDPVIYLRHGRDTLSFHLDLGATSTELYAVYFEQFRTRVLKQGHSRTVEFGGAGGMKRKLVFTMPAFDLALDSGHRVVLDSVDVMTEPVFPGEKFYGNVGQDFTSRFDELVLNFRYMYVQGT
jgi:hypothetical protein